MSTQALTRRGVTSIAVTAAVAMTGALLLVGQAAAETKALTPPALKGVAALPGPLAPASKAAATMGVLTTKPDIGLPGAKYTVSGKGLPANKTFSLYWNTATVTWVVDARPDSVDYLGRKADKLNVVIGTATTDASGAFSVTLTAPKDFGGIHDIYAVVDGVQLAKGGFLIARHATISPKKGPIGTMITLTYSGLGASLYEGGAAAYYDNKYIGALMANWTRGVAVAKFRASGPVGTHVVQVGDAISVNYLNIPQAPIPWAVGASFKFTVTKDAGLPKQRLDWPANVTPTLDAKTTMFATALNASTTATARLSSGSGAVNSKVAVTAAGLTPAAPVELVWSTVVGNRVNCTGTCWSFVSVPLANGTAAPDGTLSSAVKVPDGLGGWHVVQVMQNGQVKAQVPYFVKRSVVGISALKVKAGQPFTIHLKGVGWTQLDNTIAVDYDNSYVGYGCGFNSNGDVVLNLIASGAPGTHLIDMYPLLYTQQPSYANTPYGMVPVLTYAQDVPGLALGYQLPAIRLAIQVVK
jgi:hypothetical protein